MDHASDGSRSATNIFRDDITPLDGLIEQGEFFAQSGPPAFRQGSQQILNHCPQSACDLKISCAVEANFPAGELHEILPVRRRENHSHPAVAVLDLLCSKCRPPTNRSRRCSWSMARTGIGCLTRPQMAAPAANPPRLP